MTDIITRGFCDLNEQEMLDADGGSILLTALITISICGLGAIGTTAVAGAVGSAAWKKADAAANAYIAAYPDSPAAEILASKPRG